MALVRLDPSNLRHPPPYLPHPTPQAHLVVHPLLQVHLGSPSPHSEAQVALAPSVEASHPRLEMQGVEVLLETPALVVHLAVRGRVVASLDNRPASSNRMRLEGVTVYLASRRVQALAVSVTIVHLFLFSTVTTS